MQQPEKIITIPFASQGDKTDVSATPNPNIINYPQGYSQNFELPLGAGGQAIQRQGLNGLLFDITNILKYIQFGNKATFDSRIAESGGYPLGAVLTYYPDRDNPQTSYEVVSMKNNNTDNFVTTPSFIGTSWMPYNQGIVESGTNSNGSYIKFSNGMLICWAGNRSYRVTFPMAFASTPTVIVNGETQAYLPGRDLGVWNYKVSCYPTEINTTGCAIFVQLYITDLPTSFRNGSGSYVALGHWK